MKTINELLQYAKGKEKEYNLISNILHNDFNIASAETTLVILYVVNELKKKELKK